MAPPDIRRMVRTALVLALSASIVVAAAGESGGRVARVVCRDGARCDLDRSCDGVCLVKVCPQGGGSYAFCGRRKAAALFPQPVVAGQVSEECSKGQCLRVRCRNARRTCEAPTRPCTLSLGPPFDRQFECRASLGRSTSDTAGLLYLAVRDGARFAGGIVILPSAVSGHYTSADGARAHIDLWLLAGFDYVVSVDRFTPGTELDADVTIESEIRPGLSEVRGTMQGVFGYANGTVLVPFAVQF
jgi:hypothetical protein